MYSDRITQNVALAVMKVIDEALSPKQENIALVAKGQVQAVKNEETEVELNEAGFGGFSKKYKLKAAERRAKEALNAALKAKQKKIDAEDFKKLRKEDAEPLDELSVNTLSSYGTKAAKTTDKLQKDSNKHWVKAHELHLKNKKSGNGPYSKDAEKSIAHADTSDALLQKRKNRNLSIDLAAKKLGKKFSKGVSEDVMEEYEPAKPNAAAVERRKKLQAIEDRKEKAKAVPSNVRKHEGSAYGGAKQKDEMDESMDVAKSLAQKGMNSEPGSTTSIKRKDGKVTSWQVTGPMKKTGASDSMARARSLAQKGMKLPEETTFSGLLASIHENGLTAIHEMFVRESASEEEFNAELKIAQEKSEGKGKKAEIAKGNVQAVKNEEVELDEAKQSEEDYHSESNFPLHHNLHMHNLKYLHDAHAFHGYARDTEDPENGGGRNGAAAKAVKNIDRHVREKYGHNAVKQLQHSGGPEGDVDNFKKTLAHAKEHAQLKKEETEVELNEAGFGGFSKKYKLKAAERRKKEALKAKQKKIDGIAKGKVQAVKNEETEVVEYELDVNAINGVKMETIDERHLTAAETEKKEDTVKSMKKGMAGFKERYGDRAKEVMYATATKQAKKDA